MFKKRSRPAAVREKAVEDEQEKSATPEVETTGTSTPAEEDEEVGQSIEELILLRKLRKSKQGIDLEKLNRGEEKKVKKSKEPEIDYSKYGLHPSKKAEEHNEFEDEKERLKRLVRNNNFTQQTNALDVDKHMLAYIEREMEKRRGQAAKAEADGKPEPFDPQAELYRLAERYKLDKEEKKVVGDDDEGNVTNSMGMLTSIPEVDLGMENRLKNIEETEKAKREMMQARQAAQSGPRKGPQDEDFASSRFFRGSHRVIASDAYAMEDAKREASGLPPASRGPRDRQAESATDDQAYERFKKRVRR